MNLGQFPTYVSGADRGRQPPPRKMDRQRSFDVHRRRSARVLYDCHAQHQDSPRHELEGLESLVSLRGPKRLVSASPIPIVYARDNKPRSIQRRQPGQLSSFDFHFLTGAIGRSCFGPHGTLGNVALRRVVRRKMFVNLDRDNPILPPAIPVI